MRILFLAPQPFFIIRGTPIAVLNLLNVLSRLGQQVDLITFPMGENIEIPGIRVIRAGWRWKDAIVPPGLSFYKIWLDLALFCKAFFYLMRYPYDVIHAVEESAFMAVVFKWIFRKKVIFDMDSDIPDQLKYSGVLQSKLLLWFAAKAESWTLRKSDLVITVCQSLSEHARAVAPKTRCIQIEDPPLPVLPSSKVPPWDAQEKVILYTGNFEIYQGVGLLVEAFLLIRHDYPQMRLVLAGGTKQDLVNILDKKFHEYLDACIVCLGKVPMEDVALYMQSATILVSPRLHGTNTPMKIYSYLNSGRPVLATKIFSHTQILDDETAMLVEPDAGSLAKGLKYLLDHPDKAVQMAQKAKDMIEKKYSISIFEEKIKAVYSYIESKD